MRETRKERFFEHDGTFPSRQSQEQDSPHSPPTLQRPLEMTVHLVAALAALIDHGDLEDRPHVGPLAGQGDEHGHVARIVLRLFPPG